jgi:hypothetical protein
MGCVSHDGLARFAVGPMAESHCPICYGTLESRDVAPCYDCGHDLTELGRLAEGRHTYAEMRVFGVKIVLCDFCQVDFSSYDPTYFAREKGVRPEQQIVLVHDVLDPQPSKDKYCTTCGRRLAFVRFPEKVRASAQGDSPRWGWSG